MKYDLNDKVAASKVGDGSWQSRAAPDESQEQWSLGVCELFHHFPEPLYQRRTSINALVRRDRLEQSQRDVRTATHLHSHTRTLTYLLTLLSALPISALFNYIFTN